ncbi:MAG: UDP-2,3-diacylglucosamine diphosphatase [Gammaproteobacteria bacterium]|nr:UDP-2,3-diacylglucosamine diphosphatase [Gammaproteobacteria bacterium]MXY58497.1 UDP-2,3-diacylglucosamine diphosphatase [Gammaproteobacteria bacterium]MYF30656.1 UDP-2,3-diacylglucosamine diphosphatase [Gammaproteobacteria bacterium]MYK46292.1 UDP-2,3-diacylglucosamine diphosphatase [Gammaproteobacteria bacterium]
MSALFISDLHIDETRPAVLAGLQRLIETEAATVDALFILGDLVEVWVGDDDDGPVAASVRETLAAASRRCELYVMHGNRDFLIGPVFAADTGATLIDDPSVVEVDNERVLLAHGDAYCTGDAEYQRMRALFRSTTWQSGVLASSLEERRALAASLRARSAAANENKAANIMDVTPGSIQHALHEADASLMIHGHTHRPGVHTVDGGRRRIVLGDWDRCGWKLRLEQGDAELSCFPLTA